MNRVQIWRSCQVEVDVGGMPRTSREISGGVRDENIKLILRGDINRIKRFIAKAIAQQVVQQIRDEDAGKNQTTQS
jgi:hypothetical protein